MSEPLTAIKNLANDGSPLTCTLSPLSVQIIFYALGFLEMKGMWINSYFDAVSDAEQVEINEALAAIAQEMLP